jgi:hypothetical protein
MNMFSNHLRMEAQDHAEPIKLQIIDYPRIGSDGYVLSLGFASGQKLQATFQSEQLVSPSLFNDRLREVATGAHWAGSSRELDRFIQDQLHTLDSLLSHSAEGAKS